MMTVETDRILFLFLVPKMRILKKYFIVFRFFSFSDESGCVLSGKRACGQFSVGLAVVDPSAAPPPLFRLARTKSGWRAGQNSAGGGGGGIRRDLVNGGTSHY